jgi:OmpA-OmpF porin, OOP family
MSVKVKTSGKILIILLVIGSIFFTKIFWWDKRPKEAKASTEIGHLALPDAPEASLKGNATLLTLPSAEESVNGGTKIKWEVMAWNSQFPLMYANGGPVTTKGSLIDKMIVINQLQI